MGPNPHEQHAARSANADRARDLDAPHGSQISHSSRRAAFLIVALVAVAMVAALIIGWFNFAG